MWIAVDYNATITALAVLLIANFFPLMTSAAILSTWVTLFGLVLLSASLLSLISFFPHPLDISEYPSVLCWVVIATFFSNSSLADWCGSIAGYILVSVFTKHIKANIQYWNSVSILGKVELVCKVTALLGCSVLQWVYYYTLSEYQVSSSQSDDEGLRHVALVASFSSMVNLVQLFCTCVLLIVNRWTKSRNVEHVLHRGGVLAESLSDPLLPSFYLIPTLISRSLVIIYSLVISFFHASFILDVIIFVTVLSFCTVLDNWREYHDALNHIPLVEAQGEGMCCICLENMIRGQYVRQLQCQHQFHGSCLRNWIMNHNQCPICRESIRRTPSSTSEQAQTNMRNPGAAESTAETPPRPSSALPVARPRPVRVERTWFATPAPPPGFPWTAAPQGTSSRSGGTQRAGRRRSPPHVVHLPVTLRNLELAAVAPPISSSGSIFSEDLFGGPTESARESRPPTLSHDHKRRRKRTESTSSSVSRIGTYYRRRKQRKTE